jgi:hypothetical protein
MNDERMLNSVLKFTPKQRTDLGTRMSYVRLEHLSSNLDGTMAKLVHGSPGYFLKKKMSIQKGYKCLIL